MILFNTLCNALMHLRGENLPTKCNQNDNALPMRLHTSNMHVYFGTCFFNKLRSRFEK